MLRLFSAVCLATFLCGLLFACSANAAPTQVYILNQSTAVSDAELANMLPAIQTQVSGEFQQAWNLDARLTVTETPPADGWVITITDQATIAGALGYHDVCHRDGTAAPCGFVFAQTTLDSGGAVSSVLDHELLEILADPYTNTMEKVGSRFYLREVCDAPESDAYSYTRPGANGQPVLLSDFVTPLFFRPGHVGPYDYQQVISKALQLMPGGYISWWQYGSWHQSFARGLRGIS